MAERTRCWPADASGGSADPSASDSPESSLDYRIDADHGRVYVRFAGKLTSDLIARYADGLRKDRSFEPL